MTTRAELYKICSACKKKLPLNKYYKDKTKKYGRANFCIKCKRLKSKTLYQKNPLKTYKRNLKNKFNIALEDYDEMFEKQNGTCYICNGINESGRRLAIDHSHKTGKIRGLLCWNCNMLLGWLENYRDTIEEYLKKGDK